MNHFARWVTDFFGAVEPLLGAHHERTVDAYPGGEVGHRA